jgi:hypothetical protein
VVHSFKKIFNVGEWSTDPEIRVGVDHVSEEHEDEVGVDVALVDLVDDDVRHAAKAGLQLAEENADGAEQDWKIWRRKLYLGELNPEKNWIQFYDYELGTTPALHY